jgi:DMSO/TMAO reductase YedYZ molybdopterin-dependent catalytic subunit
MLRWNRRDATLAGLAGVASVTGSFSVAGWSRDGFVAAPIDAAIVAATPDTIVRFAIQALGSAGHVLHVGLALALAVFGLALPALFGLALARRVQVPLLSVGTTFLLTLAGLSAATGAVTPAVVGALAATVVVAVGVFPWRGDDATDPSADRRQLLRILVGTLGFVGIGTVLGTSVDSGSPTESVGSEDETETLLAQATEQSLDVPGLSGLVTPTDEFYEVDINGFDPDLAADEWELAVTGAVDERVTLDYDELRAMTPEHRFVTLRCVGESLNGHKMDTALWTGVPVADLLDRAGPSSDCGCVMVRAADGYFEEFPLDALRNAFLAYGMNGMTLPRGHGYPARLLVPGHWGEINVKWVTEFELLESEQDGYWEQRGWHGTGPVNTVAKLHAVARHDDGTVQVGGHAYAGTRGIERVEVSTDGGETWADAVLSDPLPGEDVWRQWAYRFTPTGTHEVVVRATDGTGTLQPKDRRDSFPSGATGWVSETV